LGAGDQLKQDSSTTSPQICDYEDSPWRTEFWPGREYEDRAERIALAHMLLPRGKRLCEIGAGFGRLADYYLGYDRVILLDYSRSMLRQAVDRLRADPRFVYVAADLYNLPLADSSLDTAVTVRVLHHVIDIPRAFSEVSRALRSRGHYIAEFANKRNVKAILRHSLTGRGSDPFDLTPYEFVKLNYDFHPAYIDAQLRLASLIPGDRRAVSTFRLPLVKRIVPARILAAADGLLQRPTSRWQLSPSIFVDSESCKPGAAELNVALWRCTTCGSTDLAETSSSLVCRTCSRVFPIVDGIIDFKSQM
jgi:SAM-dependent methyltransferase